MATPMTLTEQQKFDALKMRYEDHVELLRMMTKLDLQLFGGYITIQLALGGFFAANPATSVGTVIGILLIDAALAAIAAILLRNNMLRRKEAVGTLKNVMTVLGFYEAGFFAPNITIMLQEFFGYGGCGMWPVSVSPTPASQ